ncbi:MAG: MiaB/RimO family radical SAM methylthiotransferase [Candidatus Bipolaricaulota bacterium]|nr:MiaB/RimO family radical SAM methylthiotransferase [Candidatus Bipolaricaulota bacterium]
MRVTVHTLGCRVNQYEAEVLAGRLAALPGEGEVHVVNTCTVTALADRKSRQRVARLKRERPGAVVVAVGCGADGAAEGLRRAGADLLVGNRDKSRLPELLGHLLRGEPVPRDGWPSLDEEALPGRAPRVRALLKVQDGCTVGCAFCRAWLLRGPLRSKTPRAARTEAERLARAGHPEIVLVGVNLAQYGEDLPERPRLVDLLGELLEVPGVRYRLSSLNPEGVTDGLVALFAGERRLCPYLHLPLQSGDDGVLRRMGRPYTRAEYLERARLFLSRVPGSTLGADVLVGFPGEDEGAFGRTVEALEALLPLNVHVFRYSPRPGTRAAGLPGRVPPEEVARRAAALAAQARRWRGEVHRRFLGRTVEVVVEEVRGGSAWGTSEAYLAVEVRGAAPPGTIVRAHIVASNTGGVVGVIEHRKESRGD